MNPKLWLAGRAATVGICMALERLRPPVPATRDDVPINGVNLNEEWLTDVLCREVPGAQVTSFHSPGGHSGNHHPRCAAGDL